MPKFRYAMLWRLTVRVCMVRLSRTGWNNVLIFSSLILIFLFNGLHLKIFSKEDKPAQLHTVLPAEQMVLTIDFPNLSVERIGLSWRTVPKSSYSVERLQEVIEQWLQLQGQSIDAMPEGTGSYPDKVVSFWFAGHNQAFVLQIFNLENVSIISTPTGLVQLNHRIDSLIL